MPPSSCARAIRDPVEADRRGAVEQRGHRLPAAAERHAHEVGAGIPLQPFDEDAERHRRGRIAQRPRLRLRQRDERGSVFNVERRAHHQRLGDEEQLCDRLEAVLRIERQALEQELVEHAAARPE